jgi:hypothetical protein
LSFFLGLGFASRSLLGRGDQVAQQINALPLRMLLP